VTIPIAQADVYVYDTTTTPPRLVDVIPSNGYGYVYQPGYAWDGTRYVWRGERPTSADDTYGRWSFVPDDFVNMPDAFLQPNDRERG